MTLEQQLQQAQEKLEMIRKLGTASGFINEYLQRLKDFETNIETFNAVNEQYRQLVGRFRYSDYNSFQVIMRRHLRDKKK